jgi:hypothetical protein
MFSNLKCAATGLTCAISARCSIMRRAPAPSRMRSIAVASQDHQRGVGAMSAGPNVPTKFDAHEGVTDRILRQGRRDRPDLRLRMGPLVYEERPRRGRRRSAPPD